MTGIFLATFVSALLGGLAALVLVPVAQSLSHKAGWRIAHWGRYERWIDVLAYVSVIVAWVIFSLINISRHAHLLLYQLDFGVFDQVIWNSLHGRLFENSFFYDAPVLLGQRFSPILLSLVPLYAISSNPHSTAIIPPAAIAIGALPLYWFARERLGRPLALVILVGYWLSPGVQSLALTQFYETKIALALLMLGTFFLFRRRYAPFLVCLAVTLLCKEEMGFIAAGFGIYILAVQRRVSLGVPLILFNLAWTVLLLLVIIPHFQGSHGYYYLGGTGRFQYYGYLGSSLPEVVTTLLTRPNLVGQNLLIPDKINAVAWLLFPLGLLPLLGGEVAALAIPTLGYTLLSSWQPMYNFASHHYAPVFPFLFMGAVLGVQRGIHLLERASSWRPLHILQNRGAAPAVAGGFLLGAVVVAFLSSYDAPTDAQVARDWHLLFDPLTPHEQLVYDLAREIPRNAAVLVQDELTSLVSERREVYRPLEIPCNGMADYFLLDQQRFWYRYRQDTWDDMLARPDYMTVVAQDGYIVKKRAPMDHPTLAQFDGGRLTFLGFTLPLTGTVQGGQTISPILTFRANRPLPASYAVNVLLTDARGHLWAQNKGRFCGDYFSFDQWRPGSLIAEPVSIQLPPTMPAGSYTLSLTLVDRQANVPLTLDDPPGPLQSTAIDLMPLPVQKNKNSISASDLVRDWQLDQPYYVDMGEMRLIGFKSMPARVEPGDPLQVGIFWRARGKPVGDYAVGVQLSDAAGHVVLEEQSRPANDTYPTTQWNAGEVLLDWHDLEVPQGVTPGEYQVIVSLKDLATGKLLGQTPLAKISVDN